MANITEASPRRTLLILAGVCAAVLAIAGVALKGTGDRNAAPAAGSDETRSQSGPGGSAAPAARPEGASAGAVPAAESAAARADALSAGGTAGDPATTSDRDPIVVSAEFEQMLADDSELARFHAMLEDEARDDAWAYPIEQFLRDHFNATLDLSRYNLGSVTCRATGCEILALGYGQDALRGWMTSVTGLFDDEEAFEALVGGPGNMSCGGGDNAPGIMALYCTFVRDDPAATEEPAPEPQPLDAPYPDGVTATPVEVAGPVADVIAGSPELYDLHRRLEQESLDLQWSNYNEAQIAQYLAELESMREIAVHSIVCRATLCEVQMSGPDEATFVRWLPDMLDFQRLDWHELRTAGLDSGSAEDGESVGYVWFLERAR